MNKNVSRKLITFLRILALLLALPPAVLLSASLLSGGFDRELLWFHLSLATTAALFGSFSLVGHVAQRRTLIGWALAGGIILGSIGFTVGFFKSEWFVPPSNLSPLLGIFWTGPLGVVGGAVFGLIVGNIRAFHSRSMTQDHSPMRVRTGDANEPIPPSATSYETAVD